MLKVQLNAQDNQIKTISVKKKQLALLFFITVSKCYLHGCIQINEIIFLSFYKCDD